MKLASREVYTWCQHINHHFLEKRLRIAVTQCKCAHWASKMSQAKSIDIEIDIHITRKCKIIEVIPQGANISTHYMHWRL